MRAVYSSRTDGETTSRIPPSSITASPAPSTRPRSPRAIHSPAGRASAAPTTVMPETSHPNAASESPKSPRTPELRGMNRPRAIPAATPAA